MVRLKQQVVAIFICILGLYLGISMFAFNFRNPHLTQMQVLQQIDKALLWKEADK